MLFASAGIFHHAGIKILYFAFFARDSGKGRQEAPLKMPVAMGIAAISCIGIGSFPSRFYALPPFPADFQPYRLDHVVAQNQLLFWSALTFTLLMRAGIYPPEMISANRDFDWFYHRLGHLMAEIDRRTGAARRAVKNRVEGNLWHSGPNNEFPYFPCQRSVRF